MSETTKIDVKGYKVSVVKILDTHKTGCTEYKNTHRKDSNDENIYEYVDAPDKIVRNTEVIFEQTVDTVDILKIVAAINGLPWGKSNEQ